VMAKKEWKTVEGGKALETPMTPYWSTYNYSNGEKENQARRAKSIGKRNKKESEGAYPRNGIVSVSMQPKTGQLRTLWDKELRKE